MFKSIVCIHPYIEYKHMHIIILKIYTEYISVKKDGDVNVGNGGPWTELKFFRDE